MNLDLPVVWSIDSGVFIVSMSILLGDVKAGYLYFSIFARI